MGNRVLPVDVLEDFAKDGTIGELYPYFYVTVGNSMPVDRAAMFGQEIAKEIKGKVDGVILTSTCRDRHTLRGNDCKRTDREGIPAVHIATITPISLSVGANRVVEGVSITAPDRTRRINKGEGKTGTCETDFIWRWTHCQKIFRSRRYLKKVRHCDR